jgi:microcystin-dependent protein
MSEPFLGEIKLMSFNFPPRGWALCNGQLLPINQNQPLFALLGTTYGGDGRNTFGLPNLQGRVPLHFGNGFVQGQMAGEAAVTLVYSQMAIHTHIASASTVQPPTQPAATGNLWCGNSSASYSNQAPNTTMAPAAVSPAGGSQPHQNLSPYLVVSFCIALQGIFPSRN